ncbi:MAG TPA: PP2C family protein-serine/threonine phosphatase [Anaeromyxobacter sp.]
MTPATSESAPARAAARSRFELYHDGLTHSWASVVVLLGTVLVPSFVVLDWYALARPMFERFATARGVCTALTLTQWIILKITKPSRWSFVHGYVFTTLVGGVITWMTVELGGFDSSYWAGLNLVIMTNLLMPWRTPHAVVNSTAILAMYVLANAIWGGPYAGPYVAQSLYFMGSTIVIAVVTASARYTLIVREFNATTELVDTNASLERSRAELKTARDALWGEMEVAKRIQTSLLPENRRVGGYEVAARMSPAAEVGGDYYDIIQAGDDRNWLAIGDVSGHGVESGLVMMMTQTSILSLVRENERLSPADVFSAVNDVLLENISRLHSARYMTLNVVRMRDAGLTLAGKHQDVLVWRKGMGAVETVSNEGCWIGVVDDTRGRVTDQTIAMDVGDVALFFTDGATEAMNEKSEMYGEDRLGAVLASVAEKPLDEALEVLFADIAAFRAVQDDDVTMMLVRRAPEANAVRPRAAAASARSSAA